MMAETIQKLFFAALATYPDRSCIESQDRVLTFSDVDRITARWASALAANGYGPGDRIGVFSHVRETVVLGILSILRLGGVFVPLDSKLPLQRLLQSCSGAKLKGVLSGPTDRIDWMAIPCIIPEAETAIVSTPFASQDPDDPLYIYFTSGSTGQPKPVLGRNSGLAHFILWEKNLTASPSPLRVAQTVNPGFDPFLRDLFLPVLSGGCLVLTDQEDIWNNPQEFVAYLESRSVNLIHTVPSLFRLWMQAGLPRLAQKSLRFVFLAGEKADPRLLGEWFAESPGDCRCFNLYGPTETTLAKVCHEIKPDDALRPRIPVGKALPNTQIMVLDDQMQPCPPLVTGRVFIRTPFRSLGYFGLPEETSRVFIKNPFRDDPEDLVYDSGDLGQFLADGSLDLLGRKDRQVKIRGIRLELGDVEATLLQQGEVEEAAAVLAIHNEHPMLAAFLVPRAGSAGEGLEGRMLAFAVDNLVEQAIPQALHFLTELPRLANGKTDYVELEKRALAAMNVQAARSAQLEGETEKTLAQIWIDILKTPQLDREDNFFQSGGNSLDIMTLISKVFDRFEIRLDLGEVFNNSSLRGMAALIEAKRTSKYPRIPLSAPDRTVFPLTGPQRRLYILQALEPGSTVYNMPVFLKIRGQASLASLRDAFASILQNHPQLRVRFSSAGGEPVQTVRLEPGFSLEERGPWDETRTPLSFVRSFDLERDCLVRAALYSAEAGSLVLALDMHHIVADGYSQMLLMGMLSRALEGQGSAIATTYLDYAAWTMTEEAASLRERDKQFWLSQFPEVPEPLDLCFGGARPKVRQSEGRSLRQLSGPELKTAVETFVKTYQVTEYTFFLAAFSVFLARLTGTEDLVLGTASAGRLHPQLVDTIGMLTTTLPLRLKPVRGKSFLDYLEETKQVARQGLWHQNYLFESLVEDLKIPRDVSRNPLFDVFYLHQDLPPARMEWGSLTVEHLPYDQPVAKFDLSLYSWKAGEGFGFLWEYNSAILERETVENFSEAWISFLLDLVTKVNPRLCELQPLSPRQKSLVLEEWNRTEKDFPEETTLYDYYMKNVRRNPNGPAVGWEGGGLSYIELDRRAEILAAALDDYVSVPGQVVAVVMDRGPDLIPSLLACWKRRACYLPISPATPDDRISFLLKDSGVVCVLADRPAGTVPGPWLIASSVGGESRPELSLPPTNTDLAYLIYTSGSTGAPKGVQVDHRSLTNRLDWMAREYALAAQDRILQKTPITFDVSVWELFLGMIPGAQVILLPPGDEKNPEKLGREIVRHRITCMHFVPSMLGAFLNYLESLEAAEAPDFSSLRMVICSGEALLPDHVSRFTRLIRKSGRTELHNLYGPTEATIDVSYLDCLKYDCAKKVPIGRPIQNTRLYVLNADLQPVFPGCPGELFISGDNVAVGYLNRPELNRERFLPDPFRPGRRMYRTGDKCRWNHQGYIEYLGRLDFQVKIRGLRIELGEIEAVSIRDPAVQMAVAKVWNLQSENAYIALYIQRKPGRDWDENRVWSLLRATLPAYMVPQFLTLVEGFSLGSSGKLNRDALPEPHLRELAGQKGQIPENDGERTMWDIWAKVLCRRDFGVNQDFFSLGGNSLQVTQLMTLTRQKFRRAVPFELFFQSTTVRDQFRALAGEESRQSLNLEEESAWTPSVPARSSEHGSAIQERKFLLTGATGFLGIHLARDLCELSGATIILLVRPGNGESPMARLEKAGAEYGLDPRTWGIRIKLLAGDVTRQGWGLNADDLRLISEEVTDFVHAAADTRFLPPYEQLKAANVESLKRQIEWAAPRGARIHYISTASVLAPGQTGENPGHLTAEQVKTRNGYIQSKWVADRLACQLSSQGFWIRTYRPGRIGAHTRTGAFQRHDLLWQLIQASGEINALPRLGTRLDLTPVDQVSRFIAEQIVSGEASPEAVNILPEDRTAFSDFQSWMSPGSFATLSLEEWSAEVATHAIQAPASHCASVLPLLGSGQGMDEDEVLPGARSRSLLGTSPTGRLILGGLKPEYLSAVRNQLIKGREE